MDIQNSIQSLAGTDKIFSKSIEYAKVISVDKTKFECKVQLLKDDNIIDEVALSVNENATSVSFPKVGSVVIIDWLDSFHCIVIATSETDKIITGNATTTLKTILDTFTDKQKTFASDLIDAIKNATYASPAGPTSPMPINVVDFELALNNYNQAVQDFLDGLGDLYEK